MLSVNKKTDMLAITPFPEMFWDHSVGIYNIYIRTDDVWIICLKENTVKLFILIYGFTVKGQGFLNLSFLGQGRPAIW